MKVKLQAADANEKGEEAVAKGKPDLAYERFTAAINIDPSHVYYVNRAGALLQLGRKDEALADASEVIKLMPGWMKGYQRYAEVLIAKGNHGQAAQTYAYMAQLDPANGEHYTSLSAAQVQEDVRQRLFSQSNKQ
jgi:tetratricopeptide (TPR) repeat protein